jgi:hypothetical protein
MSDHETAARGQRAAQAWEVVGPILEQTRAEYVQRMADIAATELNPKARCEKVTALAVALKVTANVTNGLKAAIEAGRVAERNLISADEVARMGREQRRIFDLVPSR